MDDSALMRKLISDMLNSDPQIEVIATACDGLEAVNKVASLHPDVVTLDVEMPNMPGLVALGYIMSEYPTPVIMVSGVRMPEVVLEALEMGAVDFVLKPSGTISVDIYKIQEELINKVKVATLVNLTKVRRRAPRPRPASGALRSFPRALKRLVAIGASTGGPQALDHVLSRLPSDLPAGILIVQHMPAGFTRSFAQRLDRCCAITVKEAEDSEPIEPGRAYIAPGGYHMRVAQALGHRIKVRLDRSPPVVGLRPSVNVMMQTVAEVYGSRAVGVLLTGMGSDGAEGLKRIKEHGGATVAQDQATSVIYGMPKAAIESGCVDKVLPLSQIAEEITRLVTT